ncbi:MAG: DEAD/DEAH box helicase family protein [Fimbriimonadaceae bacterium]|nr:DEAD/DEAH box helicase family protein [Fimbriimonadaceae bacterium]
MKLKFEPNQQYQLDAINAVVDLFEGQPMAGGSLEIGLSTPGQLLTDVGIANSLSLGEATILRNMQVVQTRNGIYPPNELSGFDFSIEMETGTGKTYVFLRTLYELRARYGWSKFIVVVPSVAIREGVLKSIDLLKGHFDTLYENPPVDAWSYASKDVSSLRSFATSNAMQILVINIDAFNKDTNIIQQERESGIRPIEFIRSSNPIVVIDEAHNFTKESRREALARLNPLFTLRYSATLSQQAGVTPNILYKLDPVKAYDLKLVKRIEVDSVLEEPDFNIPHIGVKSIKATKKEVSAKLEIDVRAASGTARREVTVRYGSDLFTLSNERDIYQGFIVGQIDASNRTVEFENGSVLEEGQSIGVRGDSLMRIQIRQTVKEHFEKELRVSRLPEGQRMKVLSLFFIDRVDNYVQDDGKIRQWFIEAYNEHAAKERYAALPKLAVEQVHGGYFTKKKKRPEKGKPAEEVALDTSGATADDNETYRLIMRDKESLLALDTPLRFIFSHTALREGWDNPNVFQICTLNETKSEVKKRQEIGRGLRLPVRENGERCFDPSVNLLTVVANESYDDFARKLQDEIETDTGTKFEGRVANKRLRQEARLKKGWRMDPYFVELWERIKHKTRYRVEFDSEDLIRKAAEEFKNTPKIESPKFTISKGELKTQREGVVAETKSFSQVAEEYSAPIPDLIGFLQRETELTRGTLAQILIRSGRLAEVHKNPQQFLDQALGSIRKSMSELMVSGIKYIKIAGGEYEMREFEEHEIRGYIDRMLKVDRSIYDHIEFDSPVEEEFAKTLDARDDIRLFIKMPPWFKVDTPLGTYNPDWAIVKENDAKLYLVRETKGTTDWFRLDEQERRKIKCGEAHFDALGVDYEWVKSAASV